MNQRELSQRLEELANRLENEDDSDALVNIAYEVAKELRKLSTQEYVPGNGLSWQAIKPKATKQSGGFISKSGKKTPF